MSYASNTTVSAAKTRCEIEDLLVRRGADAIAFVRDGRRAAIQFEIAQRNIRVELALPDPNSREFTHHSRGMRTVETVRKAWEQGVRELTSSW